jgi:hypothetical protein
MIFPLVGLRLDCPLPLVGRLVARVRTEEMAVAPYLEPSEVEEAQLPRLLFLVSLLVGGLPLA